MNKIKFLREIIVLSFVAIILLIILYIKNNNSDNKPYDYIENAIVSMYNEDNEKTLYYLNKATEGRDESIYEVINTLADEEILEEFYSNKLNNSFGYAEFRKATLLIYANKSGEAIEMLKSASNQGNIEASSFLASYLYSLKRYTEAYEYYKKSIELGNITLYPIYIDMKDNLEEYKLMEANFVKYNQNTLGEIERYSLGKFLLEKEDFYTAYKILKPFIEKDDKYALYAKAMYLDIEGDIKESLSLNNEIFNKYKFSKSAIKIVENIDISSNSKRRKAIQILDQALDPNKDLQFIKANLLFENDNWEDSKKIYDNLLIDKYIPVYNKLGKYYENTDDNLKAIDMYNEGYKWGNINNSLKIYQIYKELEIKNNITLNIDIESYLEQASKLGDGKASYEIALKSNDEYKKKKYSIISLAQGEIKALELLIYIANSNNDKEKNRVYTNILINNK